MYQLYGLNTSKVITPAGMFPNTANKGAALMTREAFAEADIYKVLATSAALGVGAQTFELSIFPAGYLYEIFAIGFTYTPGTITLNRISVKAGVQTFMLSAKPTLAVNEGHAWSGKVICAPTWSIYLNLQVTVAAPVVTCSVFGYRKPLIE